MPSYNGKPPDSLKSHHMIVAGSADRLLLTKAIVEFCGSLPIYKARVIPKDFVWMDKGNGTIGEFSSPLDWFQYYKVNMVPQ